MASLGTWDAETGDLTGIDSTVGTVSVAATPTIFGNFVYKAVAEAADARIRFLTGANRNTLYCRVYFRIDQTANPSAGYDDNALVSLTDNVAASGGRIGISSTLAGVISLQSINANGGAILGTPVTINENQTYLLELKVVRDAVAGIIEWKLDGTIQHTATGLNTGATPLDRFFVNAPPGLFNEGGSGDCYYDQAALDDADYIGPYTPPSDTPLRMVRFY